MIRRRLYNPAQLTPDELKASFVARGETLEEMLRLLREQTPGRPCQHMMLIGPRGMGKTTLGLRFLHAVEETPELAAIWQPVPFHEESYGIGDLADFWLAALRHLSRATDNPEWADRADALARDERDQERLAAYALAALVDHSQSKWQTADPVRGEPRRNPASVAQRARSSRTAGNSHRAPGISSDRIRERRLRCHPQPRTTVLRVLSARHSGGDRTGGNRPIARNTRGPRRATGRFASPESRARPTGDVAPADGRQSQAPGPCLPNAHRVSTRVRIRGPGAAHRRADPVLQGPNRGTADSGPQGISLPRGRVDADAGEGGGRCREVELLPRQRPTQAARRTGLRPREVRLPGAKRTRYEVGDRFYNIYYVLRFSRTNRRRLERLVAFLHDLFGTSGMRPMYSTFLEALRTDGPRTGDSSDWLEIIAGYVAADSDFKDRENWRRGALDVAKELIGPNAPVAKNIENVFVGQHPTKPSLFGELMQRGLELFRADQFTEAEEVFRRALASQPDNVHARWLFGTSLFLSEKNEHAIATLEQLVDQIGLGDSSTSRITIVYALSCKSVACVRLKRLEGAAESLEKMSEFVDAEAPENLRNIAALTYHQYGHALADSDRLEESIAALRRVTEYIRPDDTRKMRHTAAQALKSSGNLLSKLQNQADAMGVWARVMEYVHTEDPVELRQIAILALAHKLGALLRAEIVGDATPGNVDGWVAVGELIAKYVRPDDATNLRGLVTGMLSRMGKVLNLLGWFGKAEAVCGKATDINPSDAESWCVLAEAILRCRRPRKARQEADGRGESGGVHGADLGTRYGLNWAKSSNPCPRNHGCRDRNQKQVFEGVILHSRPNPRPWADGRSVVAGSPGDTAPVAGSISQRAQLDGTCSPLSCWRRRTGRHMSNRHSAPRTPT